MKKNILVVGGNSGIGSACIDVLAEDNQIYSLTRSGNIDTPVENVEYFMGDVCKAGLDFSFLPQELHAVIYCPGSIKLKPFVSLGANDFENDFKINVIGFINTLKASIKALKNSGNASVVAFSTVAVTQGMNYHSSVATSKGALEGLIRSLAAEFASAGIRFNSVAPSLVNTPLASKFTSDSKKLEAISKRHPLNRIGEPHEIAHLVKYLVSSESSWMTGQIVNIDGGLSSIKGMA